MQFATGSYTGDGNDDRWINTPGFEPDVVIVKGDTATWAVFRTSTMNAGESAYFTRSLANFADAIQAFGANGFQVGTDGTVNTNGTVYYYAAFRDTGGSDLDVGTYTGDGNDNRNLDVVGFQPTVMWIKREDGASYGVWRVEENVATKSMTFSALVNQWDRIQEFRPTGFQVGTDDAVNQLNSTYHYVAFCDAAGHIQTGTYTGDGNDDRNITCGFNPDMVWVKGGTTELSVLRIDTMDAGDSAPHADIAPAADQIQAFAATTFQVGTSARVNSLGITYLWAAWATGTTGTTSTSSSTTSTSSSTTSSSTSSTSTTTTSTSLSTTSSSTSLSTTSTSTSLSTSTTQSTSTSMTFTTTTSTSTTSTSTTSISTSTTSSSTSTSISTSTSTSTSTSLRLWFWRQHRSVLRRRQHSRA